MINKIVSIIIKNKNSTCSLSVSLRICVMGKQALRGTFTTSLYCRQRDAFSNIFRFYKALLNTVTPTWPVASTINCKKTTVVYPFHTTRYFLSLIRTITYVNFTSPSTLLFQLLLQHNTLYLAQVVKTVICVLGVPWFNLDRDSERPA